MDAWPATTGWTLDQLAKRFPNESFKCGEILNPKPQTLNPKP